MDENTRPVTPPQQPVSMHQGAVHPHHASLAIVTAMLGMFVVLESLALGYVAMRYSERQQAHEVAVETGTTLQDRIQDAKDKAVPFLWSDSGWNDAGKSYSYLKQVNRQTNEETTLLTGKDMQFITVVAIPQVGYDGRVVLHQGCAECDNPYYNLSTFDVNKQGQPQALKIVEGDIFREAFVVSPDQTKAVFAQYDDVETGHTGKVIVYNFLTGAETVAMELADNEYFSQYFGPDAFAGAGGFTLRWVNRGCFNVTLYTDPTTPREFNEKEYAETRLICAGD